MPPEWLRSRAFHPNSGVLPFDGILDYPIGTAHNGKALHLYHYDAVADTLVYRSCAKATEGRAKFAFDHASRYVLLQNG